MEGSGGKGRGTSTGPRILACILPIISIFVAGNASAIINGSLDYSYSSSSTKTEGPSLATTESKAESFRQRYNLIFSQQLYPNLRVSGSGFFERIDAEAEQDAGGSREATETAWRPEIRLTLATPPYKLETGYSRTSRSRETGVFTPTEVAESYFADLTWRPVDYPELKLSVSRANNFDEDRLFDDRTTDTVRVASRYHTRLLAFRYSGDWSHTRDHLEDVDFESVNHEGKLGYSTDFWKRRATLYADYAVSYGVQRIAAGGGGEVTLPVSPFSGLSSNDDTPQDTALLANPALIDGDLTSGAGINLGLPPPGGDARARNMGVSFLDNVTETNTIVVWVDRDLPPEIANSFSWEIYISDDNLLWEPRQTVSPAPFGPFETSFVIRFDAVRARFVKVVTRPLSPAVPNATTFPTIFVTEIQVSLRRPAAEVEGRSSRLTQRLNLNTRVKVMESKELYYEFSYGIRKTDDEPSRYYFLNGLSFAERFGPIFSGAARVSRSDSFDPQGDSVVYAFTAMLDAVPIPTLRHSVTLNWGHAETDGQTQENVGIFLSNWAKLYEGVDVSLNAGASTAESGTGLEANEIQGDAGVHLVPHRTTTISGAYFLSRRSVSGGGVPAKREIVSRNKSISLSFQPYRQLYIFASHGINTTTDQEKSNVTNLNIGWTPLRDGAISLNILYFVSYVRQTEERLQNISPFIRWNIRRGTFLDFGYNEIEIEQKTLRTLQRTYTLNLHIAF